MVNIILKAFEGPFGQMMMEEAFRGRKLGLCISINNTGTTPDVDAGRNIWMPANKLRKSHYPDVDWTTIAPLDEDLIEKMRGCETMFLSMVSRYARHGDISYAERKRQYFAHLRYWNHMLDKEKIGLYLLFNSPHQCYDYVIYQLCKLKGIPAYNLEHCFSVPAFFITPDFERSAEELAPAFARLQKEFADPSKSIPLLPAYEAFFTAATTRGAPLRRAPPDTHLTKTSFLQKWGDRGWSFLLRKPGQFAAAALSPGVWARKLSQHRTAGFYDSHARTPDLARPYVYVPLHLEPEDAVTPRGGGFRDQQLVIHLLAATLPEGTGIYVKEHPAQGELCRSEAFYKSMSEISSVTFVPRGFDTFQLSQHAKAVATVTGTAGFEALFFGKPVFMFGHRFYQYAPGVHRIQSVDDCRKAVESVFKKSETPSARDMRLFLKAVQDCGVFYYEKPTTKSELAEREGQVQAMGRKIGDTVAALF